MTLLCEGVKKFELEDTCIAKEELNGFLSTDISNPMLVGNSNVLGKTIGDLISILWKDPAIQKSWERRNELQIMESHKIFFEDIDRIKSPTYVPTTNDVLYARVRSTGVITERHQIGSIIFELYDVGGQRNERKKWIHCFDNVDAVIYVSAVSEYDQTCFEDNDTNRVLESLSQFQWISKHELFKTTPIILLLNKRDLFEAKLKTTPISSISHFSDYDGGADLDKACTYFRKKFEALAVASTPEKEFYAHATCAIDTNNVQKVFDDCRSIIRNATVSNSGVV
jgi:GTPase SAR1 family protein